jgi:hypothetical protein
MRLAIAALFSAGLAALPLSAAEAQYCSASPLSWPFCAAGVAVNTAAAIATAPFYALSGRPYYYNSGPYYYNGGWYYYNGGAYYRQPSTSRASYRPPSTASHDDLQTARLACNSAHPMRVGNYLPHADCVNEAIEQYALPTSRYPDLVQLQEQVRTQISARIDQRVITARDGEEQMAAADKAIGAAERERDLAHTETADQQIARVRAMLSTGVSLPGSSWPEAS